MFSSICVVCTGNICRSPMGEAMLRAQAPQLHRVYSAGTHALVGRPAEAPALDLMRERGLDIATHAAQQITGPLVSEADLLLAMDAGHLRWLHRNYPQVRGRAYLWLHWNGGGDVADPFGQPREAFATTLEQIEVGLSGWLQRLR